MQMRNLLETTEALGYMIMAAKKIGLDAATIKELLENTKEKMKTFTEQAAESEYDDFV